MKKSIKKPLLIASLSLFAIMGSQFASAGIIGGILPPLEPMLKIIQMKLPLLSGVL